MRLFRRYGVWHFGCTVDGRRFRKSTKTADRKLAGEIAGEFESRQRRAARLGPQAVLTFGEAVDLYLKAGRQPRFLLKLLNRLEHVRIAEITPQFLRGLAVELYPKAGPATRNRQAIAPAQAVINHAAELGLAAAIRVRRFAAPRNARPHGDWPWILRFERAAVADGEFRLAALAIVMFSSGARIGQACRMTWEAIDLKGRSAIVPGGKRRPPRAAALIAPAVAALRRLAMSLATASGRPPRPWEKVFGFATVSGAHQAWRKLVARHGLPRLTPHEAGRHGFGTQMIVSAGIDAPTAAAAGGWASPKVMLETYAHGRTGAEAVNRAFALGRPQPTRTKGKRK